MAGRIAGRYCGPAPIIVSLIAAIVTTAGAASVPAHRIDGYERFAAERTTRRGFWPSSAISRMGGVRKCWVQTF